jgi:gamma-resorcylate decarboxylase
VAFFNANAILPPTPLIAGEDSFPFNYEYLRDVAFRLDDAESRLKSIDSSGIQYSVLLLTPPSIEGIMDSGWAIQMARKVNNYIHETYCERYPERFGFFCCVALQNPEEAIRELERAVLQLGAKGVLVNGFANVSEADVNKIEYLDHKNSTPSGLHSRD